MAENKTCPICGTGFLPSKYRKNQRVCSKERCQRQRQLENLAAWRKKNPGYFKTGRHETSWSEIYRERARRWRRRNKGKIKKYRKAHTEEKRQYMRVYMDRLRHSYR